MQTVLMSMQFSTCPCRKVSNRIQYLDFALDIRKSWNKASHMSMDSVSAKVVCKVECVQGCICGCDRESRTFASHMSMD